MTIFSDLFAAHDLAPLPDAELEAALLDLSKHASLDDIAAYITKVKRFDARPMHFTESLPGQNQIDMDNSRLIYWWYLRQDLTALPDFFRVCKMLQMTYESSIDLLFGIADSNRYDFDGVHSLIENVTRTCQRLVDAGPEIVFPLGDFKAFLALAREHGDVERAIAILRLGVDAGMSLAQAMGIVRMIYTEGGFAGYVFMSLYDELELLGPNSIDPDLLYRSLQAAFRSDLGFKNFTDLLHMAATRTTLSHNEVFSKLTIALEKRHQKAFPSATSDYQAATQTLFPTSGQDLAEDKPIKEYFPVTGDKTLRPGILPYRMSRSLEDGLQDLNNLVNQTMTEGAWIYDPDDSVWYSLGGRTELKDRGVRHECMSYDVALLSRSPVFVHLHPKEAEQFITPDSRTLAFPQLQKKMTAFLTSMPSGADFQALFDLVKTASSPVPISGLIVTSHGVTEFRAPNDERVIFHFARSFKTWKSAVFMESFDTFDYIEQFGIDEPDAVFIRKVLSALIDDLPPGFKISCHFHGKDETTGSLHDL